VTGPVLARWTLPRRRAARPARMNLDGGVELEIKLRKNDRVYHPGEALQGEVVVTASGGAVHHSGLRVSATGSVQMRVSEKAVGVFEAFFLNVRPVQLLNEVVEARTLRGPGHCARLTARAGGARRTLRGGCDRVPVRAHTARAAGEPGHEAVRDVPRDECERAGARRAQPLLTHPSGALTCSLDARSTGWRLSLSARWCEAGRWPRA
jgi:Vacuolar protein sorting-associated protein 26